jgi:hypothetical protein
MLILNIYLCKWNQLFLRLIIGDSTNYLFLQNIKKLINFFSMSVFFLGNQVYIIPAAET